MPKSRGMNRDMHEGTPPLLFQTLGAKRTVKHPTTKNIHTSKKSHHKFKTYNNKYLIHFIQVSHK